jgi:hydroxymethylpyrimidine/phosphomethylpyrimidine kinase
MKGRVLIAAGSDSGGGAGIQADIKTVTALGGYAATAITALTAQDTSDVHGIEDVAPDFVYQQMQVVLQDIGADALKTGMLHAIGTLEAVTQAVRDHAAGVPLVVDPVMVAKGGAKLLQLDTIDFLTRNLVPLATLLTPNVPEAEVLTGLAINRESDMETAGQALLALGPKMVLMKGGHLDGEDVVDLLVGADGTMRFTSERIESRHTHGTGCTLASALATGFAQGMGIQDNVIRAREYVRQGILQAPGYGKGHGPLNHGHTIGAMP